MSEELIQKQLTKHGLKVGNYEYYNIGATTLNQLKKHNIIPNKNYYSYGSSKPDALLVDRMDKNNPLVIAVIEWKKGSEFLSDKDKLKGVRQCNDVAQVLSAKIGIATDGNDFIWFNPLQPSKVNEYTDKSKRKKRSFTYIINVDEKPLKDKFVIGVTSDELNIDKLDDETRKTISLVNNLYNLLDKKNSKVITPEPINPLQLAKGVWQDIWIATGKTPEKCLYNVVELFIFKFLSDLEILTEPENFGYLLSLYDKGKSESEVLDYYAKVCRKKYTNFFRVVILMGQQLLMGLSL